MGLNGAPEYSPATGLKNKFYNWKGEKIRYQATGPEDAEQSLLLVHGMFVNEVFEVAGKCSCVCYRSSW